MELPITFPSAIFLILTILLPWILSYLRARGTKETKSSSAAGKLPPGPPRLPIIGNLHQIAGPKLPYCTFNDMAKKYGPVIFLKLGEIPTVVVNSAETAKVVLKTQDNIFASRPDLICPRIVTYDNVDVAWAPYGEYWRQVKKILTTELLTPKRVQSFRPIREQEAKSMVETILVKAKSGESVNVSRMASQMMMGVAARSAFGKKSKDEEDFASFVQQAIPLLAGFSLADLYPSKRFLGKISGVAEQVQRLVGLSDKIMMNIIDDHISKKQENETEDFVDVLLKLQKEYNLTMDNIKAVILDAFFAGSQTSSATTEWTMSELIRNPEVMKKAQEEVRRVYEGKGMINESKFDELKYLKLVIKESLRLHPPSPMLLPRESIEKGYINGYEIPAKTRILVNAWAIQRDPALWKDPETFNPERFADVNVDMKGTDFVYLPFGTGRRMCPGVAFGLSNVELPIASLLYHFDWSLPDGVSPQELDMTEVLGSVVKRKNGLTLIPKVHPCSSIP
ncbi:hypothetical protein Droror1_Dr00001467 [Drosera rotundifolia]